MEGTGGASQKNCNSGGSVMGPKGSSHIPNKRKSEKGAELTVKQGNPLAMRQSKGREKTGIVGRNVSGYSRVTII